MEAFHIRGGKPLSGSIAVSGSKNAALPLLAAAVMTPDACTFRNVPRIRDVQTQVKILNTLGVQTTWEGGLVRTKVQDTYNRTAPYELVNQLRAGICVLGPMLAARGEVIVAMPGGCAFAERPIDLHLKGLKALGAEIREEQGNIHAKVPAGGLKGAEIYLGGKAGSSVLATDNVMCAAVLAKGTTTIECAACEPEVVDLADCLNAMGARIEGAGSPRITVHGVKKLKGVDWTVIPDRIEAATFLVAGAITRSPITVTGGRPDHLLAVIDVLRQMGVRVERSGKGRTSKMQVIPAERLAPCDATTLPFPAFPTDIQAPMMALMALAEGTSTLVERIYPERFQVAGELRRMGAQIQIVGGQALIKGVPRLQGAEVTSSDLRASAALVIAGLAAQGETRVMRIDHLDRGYERFEDRLRRLGADIARVPVAQAAAATTAEG